MCNLSLLVFYHGFKFQYSVRNGCHDLTMLCLNIGDIAFITVEGADYHFIIHDISKYETNSVIRKFLRDDRGYM